MSQSSRLSTIQEELNIKINPKIKTTLKTNKLGNLPKDIYENLEKYDKNYYYLRYGSSGDGNCLYHSILNLIDDNYITEKSKQNKHDICLQFKKLLADNVTKHDYEYLNLNEQYDTIEQYKKHLSEDGKWGTDEDIIYISSFLDLNIFVFQLWNNVISNPVCINYTIYDNERPTILLYNFNTFIYFFSIYFATNCFFNKV